MAIGVNWAEIWAPVWKSVWTTVPPAAPTSTPSANYAVQPLVPYLYLDALYAAPSKPRTGMVVLADGTYWNPGSGAGYYGYYGASWVKLG